MEKNNKLEKKECLFSIPMWLIMVLVGLEVLIPIVSNRGQRVKGDHAEPINGYFRVASIPNVVWMHVQDGYGVFINEYVTTRSGQVIDLIKELSKYYWYIDKATGTVRCGALNNRSIARCIGSVIVFGDIKHKLPKKLEVHHKWWRWCNTQETIAVVCKYQHKRFHDCINSRKSHRQGVVVNDDSEMLEELNNVQYAQEYYRNIPM
jgi:hypothetical protein